MVAPLRVLPVLEPTKPRPWAAGELATENGCVAVRTSPVPAALIAAVIAPLLPVALLI